jgi:predicted MPP superfamily phosphohydrolase
MARRLLMIALALIVATAVLVGWHWYVLARLVHAPAWPEPWTSFGTAVVVAGALSLFLVPMAERLLRPPWSRVVGWPGSLWLGFAFVALVLLAISDLVVLVAIPSADVHLLRWRAAMVLLATAVFVLVGMRAAFRPVLERVTVTLDRWPAALDGFRIVQISDIHIGPILGRTFAAELVRRIEALDPDLVVVTGDLVDGGVDQLAADVAPFADLNARQGVAFVTGNHDYYSRADPWVAKVSELGMDALRNRWRWIDVDGARFALAGVDDHRGDPLRGGGSDLERALAGIPGDVPVVLLAHDPTTFVAAAKRSVDLQISGHTHGGQIWPFGLLVRVVVPFVAGLYRRGRSQLYVSRGTGFWGPPMRLGARGEITELTLVRTPSRAA